MKKKIYSGIYTLDQSDATDQYIGDEKQQKLDALLAPYYLWETIAHDLMLAENNLIPKPAAKNILQALLEILVTVSANGYNIDPAIGDIHENVEADLVNKIGADAGWFHLARSRNDQVSTDQKLLTKALFFQLAAKLIQLGKVLEQKSQQYSDVVMPGYTHGRAAMPSSFGFWWQSYLAQLVDAEQLLQAVFTLVDISPLGAGASYGVNWPIDPETTSKHLGFSKPMANALSALNNRGLHELYWLAPLLGIVLFLSRMMEDVMMWSSPEFAYLNFSEAFTTGSSIMPQKMNPDLAEKIRSKTGVLLGYVTQLATALKGTPSGYNRDSAESKEVVVGAFSELNQVLDAAIPFLQSISPNREKMVSAVIPALATKLADSLVADFQLPFRQAHQVVGSALRVASYSLMFVTQESIEFQVLELTGKKIQLDAGWLSSVLDVTQSLDQYSYPGSPNPTEMLGVGKKLSDDHQIFTSLAKKQEKKFWQAKKSLIKKTKKFLQE